MFYKIAAVVMILITMLTLPADILEICLVCMLGIHCLIRLCIKCFLPTTQTKSTLFGLYYFIFGVLPCVVVVEFGEKLGLTVNIIILFIAVAGFNVVTHCFQFARHNGSK